MPETILMRFLGIMAVVAVLAGCWGGSQELTSSGSEAEHPALQTDRPPTKTESASTNLSGTTARSRESHARDLGDGAASEDTKTPGTFGLDVKSDLDEATQAAGNERIPGYKTPAEYVALNSRYVQDAVAVVTLPADYERNQNRSYPLVIAFGGAGECARPPRSGCLAWMHYYKIDESILALESQRLTKAAFRGLVTEKELSAFNRRLNNHPYRGIILVCPYSPLLTAAHNLENSDYENYIVHELIPALKARYRVLEGSIGVDGVSMGGARSMYLGLKYPNVFASIGSIQGAFGPYFGLYEGLIESSADTLRKRSIQLVTSDKDYLKGSVERMHRLLTRHRIPHHYFLLTGPHDYIFNQGPGSLALLVFHNEALNKKPSGPVR